MSIEKDLEELITKIAPSKDIAGGFMSRDQIIQLIRKVATDASLIGYCHAERLTRERMDKKLKMVEEELIAKIAPSKDIAGGFMSRDQIIQLIRKVATDASLIGYCHAERLTRERMDKKLKMVEEELTIIKSELKDAELELIASTK